MKYTKSQKGITLVALIITIVILMILASVAINGIKNDGIIGQAQNVAGKYEQAQKEELDTLDYYDAYLSKKTWSQSGTTVKRQDGVTLNVGQIVTGYNANVDGYTGGWAVLGAENGRLLLLSTENIYDDEPNDNNNTVTLNVDDFLNEGQKLHDLCSQYANSKASSARSIIIEDIDRVITNYNPKDYNNGVLAKYGNKVTYTWISGTVSYMGTLVGIGSATPARFITAENKNLEDIKTYTVESNYYGYTASNYLDTNTLAYELLFKNASGTDHSYWLASSFNYPEKGYITQGLRVIHSCLVDRRTLYWTHKDRPAQSIGARAVVILNYDVNITRDGVIS